MIDIHQPIEKTDERSLYHQVEHNLEECNAHGEGMRCCLEKERVMKPILEAEYARGFEEGMKQAFSEVMNLLTKK